MLRAVIYCRCSTEEQSQIDALQQQVEEARSTVMQQGWILADEFIETRSGTTTERREEYNRLYEQLQSSLFDIVVIKSQDRLMRNTKDWYLFVDRLVSNGKKLFIYLEQKFYSADDALITGIKAILAEEYSKELSKKINNAHYHRQRDGEKFILPSRTYGLKRNKDGEIVLVEEEAEAIRVMFFLCRSMGCVSIAHYLAENGIRDRNGKLFTEEAIRRIIRNPIRCGTVIQNQRHFDFQTKKTVPVPKEEWIIHKNAVPAIVSEKEWHEANAAMDKRKTERNRNKQHSEQYSGGKNPGKYQLSGKIYCGECGSPFYRRYRKRNKDKKMIVEWKCQRYVQNGRNKTELRREGIRNVSLKPGQGCDNIHLDEERLYHLLEKVSERYYLGKEPDYERLAEKVMKILPEVLTQNDSIAQKERLLKEKSRYEEQKNILLNKLLDEVISDRDYQKKSQELEKKIKNLSQQIEQLQDIETGQITLEKRLDKIKKRLKEDVIKKAIAAEMIDSIDTITVFPEKLVIVFKKGDTLKTEVLIDEDFLYAARKEAEYHRIIEYMRKNPQITGKEIAKKENISLSAAYSRMKRLRRANRIYFTGHGRYGEWVVTEEE